MKKICIFCLLTVTLCSAMSQDVITTKSGEEIMAKVSEVSKTEIKYKRFDNPEGPTYIVNKRDVFMVKYQNGTKEIMKNEPETDSYNDSRMRKWTNQREVGISAFADLGGLGFTGPHFGIEARWRQLWINTFIKFSDLGGTNIGALNKAYLGNTETCTDELYDFNGFGGGFTVKCLFPFKNGHGIHLGIINEWAGYEYTRHQLNSSAIENWNTNSVSTGLGVGYSYHSPKGIYCTVGGYWGVSVFDGTKEYFHRDGIVSTHYWTNHTWTDFFGIMELTIGYEFVLVRH